MSQQLVVLPHYRWPREGKPSLWNPPGQETFMSYADHHMYQQIREKVEAVARGDVTPDHLTGSTTVRLACGLILGALEDTNPTLNENDAWEMIDAVQTAAVKDLRPLYHGVHRTGRRSA